MLSKETMNQINQQPNSRTAATAILEQLSLYGVKRIYGVIGDAIFGLMDAIAKQKAIQFIEVKHESVAAMMASAEAKFTGNLGVCISQMGPGLGNLMNGLGDAYLDGAPILAITGQAPVKKIGTSYKQYINQQEMVQAITGYSELVVHPDAVIESLSKAIHTSLSQETVSHLSIPTDIFTMTTMIQPNVPVHRTDGHPIKKLQHALELMRAARRPMILAGSNIRTFKEEVQQLAKHWGCGIAMEYGAAGIIPESDPFGLGGLGEGGNPLLSNLFKQADVVLTIGTSSWPEGLTPENAHVIQIQNKQTKVGNGMPVDCGVVGEMRNIVSQLVDGLQTHTIHQNWVKQIQQCKEAWSIQNENEGNESGYPLHPSRIIRIVEKHVTPNTIIALDEGDSTLWFMRNFRGECEHVLLSKRWRTMGSGLPAALAAKLCMPDKQIICITGDGGLAMVLADLLTAARYQLKMTLIVFNNGTLQMERNKMLVKGFQTEGTDITNPDFAGLAKACGWDAHRIQSGDDLDQKIKLAQSSQSPVLLDVPTAQVSYPNYQII